MSDRYKRMKQFVRYHVVLGEYEDAYFLLTKYEPSNSAEKRNIRIMVDALSREYYRHTGKILN